MKKIMLVAVLLCSVLLAQADEGMWLLKELNRESAARMKELGFKFPIDSLYSETNPSLKDAVVIFGRGCTGVAVSQQGLIFTNHHCGYEFIQQLSSVQHDYLKDGFASQSFAEELPAKGLTVSFLKKTEDITQYITSTVLPTDNEATREKKIDSLSTQYLKQYDNKPFLKAQILPFYSGNKYYAIVYQVFKDVRLVCTPPSSIGKFGGDTDNWMWPRHTGDFSIFRVYADKNNNPAKYSKDNVPYKPVYSVPVSLDGYQSNDYAMTVGYPGRTERYISSYGIEQMIESANKPRIEVRGAKQAIWQKAMNASEATRIQYSSKYALSSNYWKNAIGMNQAIARLHVLDKKRSLESQFTAWVNQDTKRQATYGHVLDSLKANYEAIREKQKTQTYFNETFLNGIELVRFGYSALAFNDIEDDHARATAIEKMKRFYQDYDPKLDLQVMPALLKLYAKRVPKSCLPNIYKTIDKKFKGDYNKYAEYVFKHSNLITFAKAQKFYDGEHEKELMKDPAIILTNSIEECDTSVIQKSLSHPLAEIAKGNRLYMAGLMQMFPDKTFSPDANFTQRLSYGSVKGYQPADAVTYRYYSTTKGVFEKEKPGDPEFDVQPFILDSLKNGNFGQYGDKDGSMHIDFLSTNDITGGNSGSPVFNGKAQLIGLAFDGNWEALSGDITFNPSVQRTICADIRYILYTVDHIMHCHRIIDELRIKKH